MEENMKILMVSFISSANLGDQLIVKTIDERFLSEYDVVKYDYNLNREDQITIHSQAKERSTLKKIYLDYFRKNPLVDKYRDFVNKRKVLNNKNWDQFIEDLSKADLLVFGGGNIIFDLTKYSSTYFMYEKIIDKALEFNVPTFACCVGIGPFVTKEQQKNTVETLAKCTYVTVRDEKSYNYLKDNKNTYLSIDPVFELKALSKKKTEDKKTIGFSIIDLLNNKQTTEENNQYIDDCVSLIEQLQDYKVVLYSSVPHDYRTVNEVYSRVEKLSNVSLANIQTIEELLELYTHFNLVIGARMHSLIVGVSQNTPIIGLSWQPKVRAMFEMIEQSESVFPIHEIKKHEQEIINLVEFKLNDEDYEDRILETNSIVKKRTQINHEIIKKIAGSHL